jgi:cytoskeletal protein RodZ
MKALVLGAAFVAATAFSAFAQTAPADKPDSQSLSSEKTPPAKGPGSTSAPTAEPKSGSISDTSKEGTEGGTNPATDPTGKPSTSDLGSKKTNE